MPATPTWQQYLSTYSQGQAQQRQQNQQATQGVMGGSGTGGHHMIPSPGAQGTRAAAELTRDGGGQTWQNYRAAAGSTAQGTNFNSNPDNTYAEQTYQDWADDHRSGVNLIPGAANWRAVQSFRSHRNARGERASQQEWARRMESQARYDGMRSWAESLDPRLRQEMEQRYAAGSEMTEEEIRARYNQMRTEEFQESTANDVRGHYADQTRLARQQQMVGAQRDQSLGAAAEQYNQLRLKQAQMSAARGQQGSSMDVEEQGQLGRARDQAGMQIAEQSAQMTRDFANEDRSAQDYLMQMIYSQDPAESQGVAAYLAGLRGNAGAEQESWNARRLGQQTDAFSQQLMSQAIGGGLNSAAAGISAYGPYLQAYRDRK